MSDITLTAVSVSTSSRKKSLAETKDSIKWYSWLGGCIATVVVIAAILSSSLSDSGFDFRRAVSSAANCAVNPPENHHQGRAGRQLGLWRTALRVRRPRRQCAQPGLSANIRLMFQAMVTRLHSPRTLSSPRSRNWRNPITDLMIPNTGSGVCLRRA